MTQVAAPSESTGRDSPPRSLRSVFGVLELDTRLLGMVAALAIIWIFFNVVSDGKFLTTRNLWNLSVQSSAIAIMATGMVLIIVSRNIDLSVGSVLGFIGYVMAMTQTVWIPNTLGLGLDQPYTWIITVLVGVVVGAIIGGISGVLVAYGGIPSFIVTLGGLLVWRGLIFRFAQGQTISPLDETYQLLGGGPIGSLGETASWILGILACIGILATIVAARRRKRRYGFPVRPVWAEALVGGLSCVFVLAAVWIAEQLLLAAGPGRASTPRRTTSRRRPVASRSRRASPIPVLIMLAVGIVMTYIATRRRFGRYVYAIGGNPDAAELGGINVRRTISLTFVLMGILAAIGAAVSTARLNSAVTNLGVQNELDVISAAVIGGTSFAGGIGTIPGAILGAVVMQSLRSGMLLLNVDSPMQDVIVGIVLVAAVGLDAFLRRKSS